MSEGRYVKIIYKNNKVDYEVKNISTVEVIYILEQVITDIVNDDSEGECGE